MWVKSTYVVQSIKGDEPVRALARVAMGDGGQQEGERERR